jgi:hypothetical protein
MTCHATAPAIEAERGPIEPANAPIAGPAADPRCRHALNLATPASIQGYGLRSLGRGMTVHPNQLDLGFDEAAAAASADRHKGIRLAFLLTILGALTIYLLAARTDVLGSQEAGQGSAVAYGGECAGESSVVDVSQWRLAELRAGLLDAIAPIGGRRYAEGTVTGANAWSDNSPQPVESQPAGQALSGGYEMRSWAPNGDDIAADVFVFAGPRQAQDFMQHATDTRCRRASAVSPARWPPNARNLTWVNPDAAREADVYLARGRRVYRIVDVRPHGVSSPSVERRIALAIADSLACLLPAADCPVSGARPSAGGQRLDI